jgi:hypothetical protein
MDPLLVLAEIFSSASICTMSLFSAMSPPKPPQGNGPSKLRIE